MGVREVLTKKEQDNLKKRIQSRLMIRCSYCGSAKFKKEFSYIGTYKGNICMDCQEQDNY